MGISRRALAKRLGVSESAVRKHIASGILAGAVLKDGTLDEDTADRLLKASVTRPRRNAAPASLTAARTRRLRARVRRLQDDVEERRRTLIEPAHADAIFEEMVRTTVAPHVQRLVEVAPRLTGVDGREAHRLLFDAVVDTLEAIGVSVAPASGGGGVGTSDPFDLEALGPVPLEALKADLEAEAIEYDRKVARGEMVTVDDATAAFDERMGVSCSLLRALPGRVAPAVEGSSPEQRRQTLEAEVFNVLAPLNGDVQ